MFDLRVGDSFATDVAFAVPGERFHMPLLSECPRMNGARRPGFHRPNRGLRKRERPAITY
ncbi:MAG TPA: hypothetical protein VLI93_05700, partial [Acetobacteraceae bacterium]|nr:hypothetical protein [Acetobacteraceae bacterium]